jgi:hypothetical protein
MVTIGARQMPSKSRLITVVQIAILALTILVGDVTAAADTLKLPPTTTFVVLEVSNGTQSYFDTKLSQVPAGYDVTNRTYLGWCIDVSTDMPRSPATHTVFLYSSLSPPGDLANEDWKRVNYILNHKKGEAQDIQEAIWYFINLDGEYLPQRSMALAIVDDAKANGTNFAPTVNQTAAVIAYPVFVTNPYEVQISIIEVTVPESGTEPTPTPSQTAPTPTPTSPYASPTPTAPQTTPTPAPTSSPYSSPTPTPSQPVQTSPTPTNGSQGQNGTIGEVIALALIAALIAIFIILLYWRRRKRTEEEKK